MSEAEPLHPLAIETDRYLMVLRRGLPRARVPLRRNDMRGLGL